MSEGPEAETLGPDRRTYEQYLDERKLLIEGERAAGQGFDKTLLTLSAGAIALSVTFVEKLGSAGKFKPLLYVSWGVLAFGLLLNVRAFLLLQNSYDRLLAMNDEIWETGTTKIANPFRTRVGDFNHYSFWCFVVGILLLLVFAGVNYESSSKEPDEQQERVIVIMEDNKGIITRIVEGTIQKTAAGPNVVKLPHAAQGAVGTAPANAPSQPPANSPGKPANAPSNPPAQSSKP